MAVEKRRSDRLMLTIPLHVEGRDGSNLSFNEKARSLTINRHGARIQVPRPLIAGQTVKIINLVTHRQADFRVVGPLSPPTEKGGEYGVESLTPEENLWGIQFPPLDAGRMAESKALLECNRCRLAAVIELSLVEVEVLDATGVVARECELCGMSSSWSYAENDGDMGFPPGESTSRDQLRSQSKAPVAGAERRRHRRVCLNLPVRIRDFYGSVESFKTENVSKGGLCFRSEKDYDIGQGIMVVCPYRESDLNIEVRAKIVRRRSIAGTRNKLYGVRYEER